MKLSVPPRTVPANCADEWLYPVQPGENLWLLTERYLNDHEHLLELQRLNRIDISDAHGVRNECTPTFYERFEEAFLRETMHFVDAVLDGGDALRPMANGCRPP